MYSLHELFCRKKKHFLQLTVLYLNVTTKSVLLDHYNNILWIIFEVYLPKEVLSDNGDWPGDRVTETGFIRDVEHKTEKNADYNMDSLLDRFCSCSKYSELILLFD